MSFSTFTHQKRSELLFIDVDPKPVPDSTPPAMVKEERPPTPEEKLKTQKEKLQCSECLFQTESADRMTRHMRRHRGENPFQCTWCDYSTYNSVLFGEHVNIHKGVKPYQCRLCDYRSVSKKYIKKHESRHVTCDKCGFAARGIRHMRRHLRLAGCRAQHGDKANVTATLPPAIEQKQATENKQQADYRCENCNKFYLTADCLKLHIKAHKLCPECGEGFSTVGLLKHRRRVHGVKQESPPRKSKFKCTVCEYQSNCHQKILLHLIHHPGPVDPSIDVTPLLTSGIL